MSLPKETVRKIAHLAYLEMSEAALDRATPQVGGILNWIEQLAEVNTDGVEPLANVIQMPLILRTDAITDGACQDKVLANAPEHTQGFFVVPKIVEQAE